MRSLRAPTARVLAHSVTNRGNRSRFDRFAQTCVGALGSRHTVREVRSLRRSGRPCRSKRGASPARGKPGSRPWMGGDPTSVAMDGLPRRSGFPRQARRRQPDVAAVGANHSDRVARQPTRCGRKNDSLRESVRRVAGFLAAHELLRGQGTRHMACRGAVLVPRAQPQRKSGPKPAFS